MEDNERTVAYDMMHGGTEGVVYLNYLSKCYIIENIFGKWEYPNTKPRAKIRFFDGKILEEVGFSEIIGNERATPSEIEREINIIHSSTITEEERKLAEEKKDDIPF